MQEILKASQVVFESIIHYPEIQISAGQATFLQGASGCGKSTLLKLLNGTLSPHSGTIYYEGTDIESLDTIQLRRKVLLAGQSVYLFRGTILDNFIRYHTYRGSEPPEKEQLEAFLSLCCVDFPLDANCNNMSGGERQRVYIAVALSLAPKVLMLDEPTSALDEKTAHQFLGNIKQYCREQGLTLVVVSHDAKLTDYYADQVIRLTKDVR